VTLQNADQNAEIQALIHGIDEVLSKNTPRLPWVMSNDALQQRHVLEQARQYLGSLQQQQVNRQLQAGIPPSLQANPASPDAQAPGQAPGQVPSPAPSPAGQASAESAQQVLQAVLQEMNYWRVNMLQPLRTEIDSLQRQRELLSQEVRQLEGRQQALSGSSSQNQQLMEFLQAAMGQMQANLSGQVTQMIANLPAQAALPAANQNLLSSAERVAQTQPTQALTQVQSDQLMLKLDSTLQIIFESLNRNVQAYQESMEQGLDRMHNLGQQGEAMFTFLVNRLAQQLGREATSFLQSGAEVVNPTGNSAGNSAAQNAPTSASNRTQGDASSDAESVAASADSLLADSPFKVADFLSQVPEPRSTASFVPAVPFNLSEEVLDIAGLDLADLPEDPDSELAAEINQLDLATISDPEPHSTLDAGEPFDLFSGTQPLPATATTDGSARLPEANLATARDGGSRDLESALDLLNQLSAEMQADAALGELESSASGDLAGNLARDLAADLAAAPELSREPEFIAAPDSLYDDAFYSNLFQLPVANPDAALDLTPDLAGSMTLEQAWFDGLGDPAQSASPVNPASQPEPQSAMQSPVPAPNSSVSQSLDAWRLDQQAVDPALPAQPAIPLATETIFDLAADLAPAAAPSAGSFDQSLQALIRDSAFEAMPVNEAPDAAEVDLGMTLDALAPLGSPVEPQPPVRSEPPAVTIEGLEGLFEDLPDLTPSDASPSQENQTQVEAMADLFLQVGAIDPSTDTLVDLDSEPETSEKKNF
jgi:hypothetical protein